MKKPHELLEDAIGLIDDDLILDAKEAQIKKSYLKIKPSVLGWCAFAASFVIVITATLPLLFPNTDPLITTATPTTSIPDVVSPPPTLPYFAPTIAENIWMKENFTALSVFYGNYSNESDTAINEIAQFEWTNMDASSDALQSASVPILYDKSIQPVSILANRYIACYTDTNIPVFYDLQENSVVNLEDRIIGEDRFDIELLIQQAFNIAEKLYPGTTSTERNCDLLREYIYCIIYDVPYDSSKQADIEFMRKLPAFNNITNDLQLQEKFYTVCCAQSYYEAQKSFGSSRYDPCIIRLHAVDMTNGLCLVSIADIIGNQIKYLCYNVITDTSIPVAGMGSHMYTDGAIYRFSADGSMVTIAYPECSSTIRYRDLYQQSFPTWTQRKITYYDGEYIRCLFIDQGKSLSLHVNDVMNSIRGYSEGFISPKGSVVYFKLFDETLSNRTFYASDEEWFGRLQNENSETDQWVFCTFYEDLSDDSVHRIILQGNFIRLTNDESAVIMERGGAYFVYSISDGEDITEQFLANAIPSMVHERLLVYQEDGYLYLKDAFSDSAPQKIAEADDVIFSEDGAFAFVHKNGDAFVTCINLSSLDSCRIEMDPALSAQLNATPNAVFQMMFNDAENTLTMTYYIETSVE